MTTAAHAGIVDQLWRAQRDGALVPPPTHALPDLQEAEAYAIQRELMARRESAGDPIVGWKVGMASAIGRGPAAPGPIYGRLLASMIVPPGEPVRAAGLHEPEVEGEIAFRLDAPLRGPGVTVDEVLAATHVLPAIEILAGRLEGADHAVVDLIADNAFSALAAVGDTAAATDGLDLRLAGMAHWSGAELVATGAGARVLGHPAAAVAWLAGALHAAGEPRGLEAGQVVLSGSLAPAVPARAGDAFTVEVDRVGRVTVAFS